MGAPGWNIAIGSGGPLADRRARSGKYRYADSNSSSIWALPIWFTSNPLSLNSHWGAGRPRSVRSLFDSQQFKPLSSFMQTGLFIRFLLFALGWAILVSSSVAQTNFPAGKLTPTDRLKTAHLKAAHQDALRLQQSRKELPPLPGLHDYKSILHAHAEDSAHTGGTRPEMLADAKKAGVQAILLTDHLRPPRDFMDSWRRIHDGVLFIPGSEAKGFLVYPFSSVMDKIEQARPELIAAVTASNGW